MENLGNENSCLDEASAKKRAYALKSRMDELGHAIPLTHAYEAIATSFGYRNWPTMKAALKSSVTLSTTSPSDNNTHSLSDFLSKSCGVSFEGGSGNFGPQEMTVPGGTIICGGSGTGKSVLAHSLVFSAVDRALATHRRLPRIGIVDIGDTTQSLISTIKARVGAENADQVRFLGLRPFMKINPFDTPLSYRMPTRNHYSFLGRFLHVVLAGALDHHEERLIERILRSLLERLYVALSNFSHGRPKAYIRGVNKYVDQRVTSLKHSNDLISWWDVARALKAEGYRELAAVAQRQAVPVLADMVTLLEDEAVVRRVLGKGQEGADDALKMKLAIQKVLTDLPILDGPTTFTLGGARVVAIDVSYFSPIGGVDADRISCLAYMLATHVLSGGGHLAEVVDPPYYTAETPDKARADEDTKRGYHPDMLVLDEFRRSSRSGPFGRQTASDINSAKDRETAMVVVSQSHQGIDMTKARVVATGSPSLAETDLKAVLGLASELPGFSGDWGFVSRLDNNARPSAGIRLSPVAVWAFTTTSLDIMLKDDLVKRVGLRQALVLLAKAYPSGTATLDIVDRMASLENDIDRAVSSISAELVFPSMAA